MTGHYEDAGLQTQTTATHFGLDMASGSDESRSYQLSIDELPKHDNGYTPRGVQYLDEEGFLPKHDGYVTAVSGQITPPPKEWYMSKTIWFNAIVIAVGLATQASPALESFMSADVYAVIATFVAFINAVLRLATGQPIKSGGA